MSVLTDLFTSLSNKIRSKLGTTTKYTPAQAIAAIDAVYNKGATDTKKGNAALSDVLATKTFTSSTAGVNQTGTMPNRGAVSPSGLNCGGSYTIPAGYHNGSGKVTANSLASQTRVDSGKSAVTAGAMVSGYQGWVNGTKITGTFTAQAGSASPSTSSQTKYPDSGKYFNSFTVSAISPQRSASSQVSSNKAWTYNNSVYFGIDYGWYPAGSYGSMSNVSEKYITYAALARDIGVTANTLRAGQSVLGITGANQTGTYTPTGANLNNSAADMTTTNNNRYVNTAVCYNAGYTAGANSAWIIHEADGTVSNTSFATTKSGLVYGRRYVVTVFAFQVGGTYSGVGSGAKIYATPHNGEADGNLHQLSCQSANTSGLGGMAIWGRYEFIAATTGNTTITVVTINNLNLHWIIYISGGVNQ